MNDLISEPSSSRRTSATLLDRVRQNDPVAWQRLVDLYGPLVFHWGRRFGLRDEDAADLMQEVFLAVARAVRRFEHSESHGRFRGWLWTITRNRFRDWHRRRHDQFAARGGDSAWQELAAIPEEWSDDATEVTHAEVRSLFQRALNLVRDEFQPQTWEAFWRTVVDGQSTEEVATALGLSAASVRQAKSRVLRRLRAELESSL